MDADGPMLYLDNNATTIMPLVVKKAMIAWCNRGNPSSGYAAAKESRKMMNDFRRYIGTLCGINPCCPEDRDDSSDSNRVARADPARYKIIFTSGASEANCMLLQGIVCAYAEATGKLPHIVISAIEHKSLLAMAQSYTDRGLAATTYVQPEQSGHILPSAVEACITPTTCIVCVMHANNETGAINDVKNIGRIAHRHNVPFHCDTVQTFGKSPINPIKDNVDSFCVSFHKLHGPPGVGALIIKQQLLSGYHPSPMIFGSQNEGLRGGTENIPGIGAAYAATRFSMDSRSTKNARVLDLKRSIMEQLAAAMPARPFTEYKPGGTSRKPEIIFLSGADRGYLSNTLLLSIVIPALPRAVCNGRMKSDLESMGVVVSVGSACNTASPTASHVLFAMGADEPVRRGTLRVSLGDATTADGAKHFVRALLSVIGKR